MAEKIFRASSVKPGATITSRKIGRGCPKCARERTRKGHTRGVLQISMKGKIIKKYESINSATQKTGIRHISDVCRGIRKQAGGFIWKYK